MIYSVLKTYSILKMQKVILHILYMHIKIVYATLFHAISLCLFISIFEM